MNRCKCLAVDSRQKTLTGHLIIYYDAVMACIGDAKSILTFATGDAKDELKTALKETNSVDESLVLKQLTR